MLLLIVGIQYSNCLRKCLTVWNITPVRYLAFRSISPWRIWSSDAYRNDLTSRTMKNESNSQRIQSLMWKMKSSWHATALSGCDSPYIISCNVAAWTHPQPPPNTMISQWEMHLHCVNICLRFFMPLYWKSQQELWPLSTGLYCPIMKLNMHLSTTFFNLLTVWL